MGSKWSPPSRSTDNAADYKINIEMSLAVLEPYGRWFNVESLPLETMQVFVQGGWIFKSGTRELVEVSDWTSSSLSVPSGNPRIDMVVLNDNGEKSIITGSENASPSFPSVPEGCAPLGVIYLIPGMTKIYQENIKDVRMLNTLGYQEADSGVETFTDVGSYTFVAKKPGPHFVVVVSGGGGGSSGNTLGDGGGGGGAGQQVTAVIDLNEGEEVPISVGKGGTGGYQSWSNGGNGGQDGEESLFGNYIVAEAGKGSVAQWAVPGAAGEGGDTPDEDAMGFVYGEDGVAGQAYGDGGNGGKGGTLRGWGNGGTAGAYSYGSGGNASGKGCGGGGGGGYLGSGPAGAGGNGSQGFVRVAW